MRGRLLYFSRTNSAHDEERLAASLHIGPAYQKLVNVVKAINVAGCRGIIVTVPVCGELGIGRSTVSAACFRERSVPFVSLGIFGNRYLNRFYAALRFLFFSVFRVRRPDKVVLYNFFPEYIPAALYLKLIGMAPIMDVEDAPRNDEGGLVGLVGRFSFRALRALCDPKVITVSNQVGDALGFSDRCVVYGASSYVSPSDVKLCDLDGDSLAPLRIVYGGSLMFETGVDVFVSAMSMLLERYPSSGVRPIAVTVTGFGEVEKLSSLIVPNLHPLVSISLRADIPYEDYCALISGAHVGLCLKLPGTGMGDTTFPSKVVEIVRSKLLLVSTPVSDVPNLMSGAAVILEGDFPTSLFDAISKISNDPEGYAVLARRGVERSNELFEFKSVGSRIKKFVGLG